MSQNIEYIGEKAYRIHIIEKGQTLYSISKAYNISIEEIQKDNPETLKPLSIDQIIKASPVPRPSNSPNLCSLSN